MKMTDEEKRMETINVLSRQSSRISLTLTVRSILTNKYRYSSRDIAGSIRAWHARPRLVQVYVNK